MSEELLEQLEAWHEEDEFEEIVDAITDIPEEERDYVLVSHLGRALNNLERYDEAVEQFLSVAEEGQEDPLWHYRLGLAYYYLERYDEAKAAFEEADRLDPGDEETLEFLEWIKSKTEEQQVDEPSTEAVVLAAPVIAGDLDLSAFWEDSEQASEKYELSPPSDDLIESVEEQLVFKLPASYVSLMKIHNGGIPRNRFFPAGNQQYIEISGILGIGREKSHALCGELGSRHIIEEGGYPEVGVVICDCPSGTEVVMLDYRNSGNDGEPEVIHIDRANDYKTTRLASNFDAFVRGLVNVQP